MNYEQYENTADLLRTSTSPEGYALLINESNIRSEMWAVFQAVSSNLLEKNKRYYLFGSNISVEYNGTTVYLYQFNKDINKETLFFELIVWRDMLQSLCQLLLDLTNTIIVEGYQRNIPNSSLYFIVNTFSLSLMVFNHIIDIPRYSPIDETFLKEYYSSVVF